MLKPLPFIAALTLTACAGNPSKPAKVFDVAGPMPAKYQATIKTAMSGVLKDPYSAKYTFVKPARVSCTPNLFFNEQFNLWKVGATVNSKNSFGAYTGAKPYRFWLSKGQVVGVDNFNPVYPNLCNLHNSDWQRIRTNK